MELWDLCDLTTPWCMHVVVTLGIADKIEAGHRDIAALATEAKVHQESLHRVLRHLANKGVFVENPGGTFELNELSRGMLNGQLRLGMDLDAFGGRMANAWGTLLSAVRTGKPAYQEAFGRPFWEDLEANPAIAESFDELMSVAGHGAPDPDILPVADDWKAIHRVIDVGGGTGALLAEILRKHNHIQGGLVDLPRTIARSAEVFRDAGVSDRVTTFEQSFFDPLPAGADLYILKSVLGDWPDEQALSILQRCAEAAGKHGRVVVFNEGGPGDDKVDPALLMMVLVGGKARTLDELKALALRAGLQFNAVGRQPSGRVVVEFTSR